MMTYAEALAEAHLQYPDAPPSELETLAEEIMEEEQLAIFNAIAHVDIGKEVAIRG